MTAVSLILAALLSSPARSEAERVPAGSPLAQIEAPVVPIVQLPAPAAQPMTSPGMAPAAAMPATEPLAAVQAAASVAAPAAEVPARIAALMDGSSPSQPIVLLDDTAGEDAPALAPVDKTRAFNASKTAAGSFAEIGAGQSVAGYFYQGKQAANTVITSISAYDKESSNDRYGPAERFVSEQRLRQMLDKESAEVIRLVGKIRSSAPLFAFANTVTTKKGGRGQGWVGLAFQENAGGPWGRILLHVNLLDSEVLDQHEALGILGVNLVHGAYSAIRHKSSFIKSLADNVGRRIEIDSIGFEGEGFSGVDNRVMGLHLLHQGLAKAILFDPKGRMVPVYEATWGRPLIGHFPQIKADTLARLLSEFKAQPGVDAAKTMAMDVVNLRAFADGQGKVDVPAFVAAASEPNFVLVTHELDGQGLKDLLLRLNASVKAVVLPRPAGQTVDKEIIPDAAASPRPPVTVYYYDR